MPVRKIQLLVMSDNSEMCAKGLRLLTRTLGTDSVTNERPNDYAQKRAELAEKGAQDRLLALVAAEDEAHRELAAAALGAWLGDAAYEALIKASHDEVTAVRATAIGALEGWPESEQAYELLLLAIDDAAWLVRMQAARALRPFAGVDADNALLTALLDPNSFVRSCAGESLRQRDRDAIVDKVRAFFDHPAPYVFDAALDLMGEIGTEADAAFLAKVGSWRNLSQPSHVRKWARGAAKRIRARLAAAS